MRILSSFLILFALAACGSVGDANAQAVNETKTSRLLVGPSTGTSAYMTVGETPIVNNAFAYFAAAFTAGTGGSSMGIGNSLNIHASTGANTFGYWGAANVTLPTAGNHSLIDQMHLTAPGITSGGATVTNATTLNIDGAPTGAANNRALWVQSGTSEFDGPIKATSTVTTGGYTVATLPAGTVGMRAYITDQLTACAAIGAAITGGGVVVCPVFYNGAAWVSG